MSAPGATLLLTAGEIRQSLQHSAAMSAIVEAFRLAVTGLTVPPIASQVPLADGSLHVKAGGLRRPEVLSVKANVRPQRSRAYGALVLFDTARSAPEAILDAGYLTGFRTAAVAVIAARALGATEGRRVAVIGAGPIAGQLLAAIQHAMPAAELHVWSRDEARAGALAARSSVPVQVHREPGVAAGAAEVVFTCTPAREALLTANDLAPDAVVLAMGSDEAGKQELEPDVLAGATVVADDPDAALAVGECASLTAGRHPVALSDVLAGAVSLPVGPRRVFDSVGTGFVDTAVARLAVTTARTLGLGQEIRLGA